MPVRGARGQLLGDEGSLDISFLDVWVPDMAGRAQGPHALEPRRLLGEEVAEAPPELHHPRRKEGEAARGTAQGAPYGADELGEAGEPLLIEDVDGAVVQELACQEQRGM